MKILEAQKRRKGIALKQIAALILIIISTSVEASPWQYQAGKVYCNFTHPAEMVSPVRRSTCEEQHVIQQQSGGLDQQNVVWWSASSHVSTDVWDRQTWENNRPWAVIGFTDDNKTNLEKAYMLGTFGSTWSLFQHSYRGRGESSLIMAEFDGVSNLLYGISWLANLPQKYINKVAYISDRGYWHLMLDMLVALFVLGIEGIAAILSTFIGLIIGSIFNPLDTLFAIPGGLWLLCETIIAAVANYIIGGFTLATSGLKGLILLPFAMGLSITPLLIMAKGVSGRGRG